MRDLDDSDDSEAEALTRAVGAGDESGAMTATSPVRTAPASSRVPERLGEFRIQGVLGQGGMGVVYSAIQEPLGREVAVKMVHVAASYNEGVIERFRREIDAVARLQHPGIVPIYTVGEQDGLPFYAMERIRGASLAEIVRSVRGRRAGDLQGGDFFAALAPAGGERDGESTATSRDFFAGSWIDVTCRVVRAAAEALEHAHRRGVVHRDIKPSNIMITAEGRVVVLDFGLAVAEGTSKLTQTGAQVGSLPYMAPEQVRGEHDRIDRRTDVYGLGVTLYEMLALSSPYLEATPEATRFRVLEGRPTSPHLINDRLGVEAETVCLVSMDPDARRRYASAEALAADLDNVLERRPISARRPGPLRRAIRFAGRRPGVTTAILFTALILTGVPATLYWRETVAAGRIADALEDAKAERDAKERNRARAERNFERAKKAVDAMLTRVGAHRLADMPHMESLRRELLSEAVAAQREFLVDRSDDPGLRYDVARALHRAAGIGFQLGEVDQAAAELDEAIVLLANLIEEHPARLQTRFVMIDVLLLQAKVDELRGDAERALERMRSAIAWLDGIAPEHQEDDSVVNGRASALLGYGAMLARLRRTDEAETELLRAERLSRVLLERGFDEGGGTRNRLVHVYTNLGHILRLSHRDAGPSYREATRFAKELYDESPASSDARALYAACLESESRWQQARGDTEDAGRKRDEAVRIIESLMRDFPAVPKFANLRAEYDLNSAVAGRGVLPDEEVEEYFRSGVERLQRIVDLFPGTTEWRTSLAGARCNFGMFLTPINPARAREQLSAALALVLPESPETVLDLETTWLIATIHANFVESASSLGDDDAELEHLSEGLEYLDKCLKQRPTHPPFLALHTMFCQRVALAALRDGRPDEAAEMADRIVQVSISTDEPIVAGIILIRCAEHARTNEDEDAWRLFGDRAVLAMRAALSRGFSDRDFIVDDPRMRILDGIDSYEVLLDELDR